MFPGLLQENLLAEEIESREGCKSIGNGGRLVMSKTLYAVCWWCARRTAVKDKRIEIEGSESLIYRR